MKLTRIVTALLCMTVSAPISLSGWSDEQHTIQGTVVDSHGAVVARAAVSAMQVDGISNAGELNWVTTDELGRFRLTVHKGDYVVRAKKEADGYPDPTFLLCAEPDSKFPEVQVHDANVADVMVALGAKGGTLLGAVVDDSAQPVPGVTVKIEDADTPSAFVELTADEKGRFEFVVPRKPLRISARASGYSPTLFQGGETIRLADGEQREILVRMEK